ncbi:hypothetical protein KP509_1Z157800 [Ceratopteris richardii]|nr:hypothetical protein KP509_1Z157800 [Ceratopteris richardii]
MCKSVVELDASSNFRNLNELIMLIIIGEGLTQAALRSHCLVFRGKSKWTTQGSGGGKKSHGGKSPSYNPSKCRLNFSALPLFLSHFLLKLSYHILYMKYS